MRSWAPVRPHALHAFAALVRLTSALTRTVLAVDVWWHAAGEAEGVGRAKVAVDDALDNPLLESAAIAEARGCLVNVSGGADLTLFEVGAVGRAQHPARPAPHNPHLRRHGGGFGFGRSTRSSAASATRCTPRPTSSLAQRLTRP